MTCQSITRGSIFNSRKKSRKFDLPEAIKAMSKRKYSHALANAQ